MPSLALVLIQVFSFLGSVVVAAPVALALGNEKIDGFSKAKKLAAKIHAENSTTIYCPCKFKGKVVDLKSCGYKIQKDSKRARRLEWEHVVPAEAFGNAFAEWREGSQKCKKNGRTFKGRKCAETNAEFRRMEGDLYNLWPSIGELNGLRSNFSMAAISGKGSMDFGACKAKIEDRKFEPMDTDKGIVARVYMYMDKTYPGRGVISGKNEKLFEAWDKMYPVSAWECKRGDLIRDVQGNKNDVLESRCKTRLATGG